MRDGALSMKSYIDSNDFSAISTDVYAYIKWVMNVQHISDSNNIDVRVEPKFNLPSGQPYTGGWCRPQNDGPGLR
jgi:glucoamylase